MVEKKEGNEMDCRNCGTALTCRSKYYKASGNYPEKTVLQWQNEDGTAHYSTKDGKNFSCNIPEGIQPPVEQTHVNSTQTTMQSEQELSKGEQTQEVYSLATITDKIKTLQEVCQSILHIVADLKTEGVKLQK